MIDGDDDDDAAVGTNGCCSSEGDDGGAAVTPPPSPPVAEQGSALSLQESLGDAFERQMLTDVEFVLLGEGEGEREGEKQSEEAREREGTPPAAVDDDEDGEVVTTAPAAGGRGKRVRAHRLVLAVRSAIFRDMFYGSATAADDDAPVEIRDVGARAFETLLHFLYTDSVELSMRTAADVRRAALRYGVAPLQRRCDDYLVAHVDADNVFDVVNDVRDCGALERRCDEIVRRYGYFALSSPGFVSAPYRRVLRIVRSDDVNVDELDLFAAVVAWASADCRRRDVADTPTNQRAALGVILQHVRFERMSPTDFANGPATSGLLTDAETLNVFMRQLTSAGGEPPPLFNARRRYPDRRIREGTLAFWLTLGELTALPMHGSLAPYDSFPGDVPVGGFDWSLEAAKYESGDHDNYYLFLGLSNSTFKKKKKKEWRSVGCAVEFYMRLVNQLDAERTVTTTKQSLGGRISGGGVPEVIPWQVVIDPRQGFIKDGKVNIEVFIKQKETE